MARAPEEIADLLERLRRGDEEARGPLVAEAYDCFRGLARRMLRGSGRLRRWVQTDDVMQGAALRLDRALRGAVPGSPLHYYRLTVLQIRRELIDLARHYFGPQGPAAKHHTDPEGKAADRPGGPLQDRAGPADDLMSLEPWTRLHRKAEELPQPEREVFELRWYRGLKPGEVARALNVSPSVAQRAWQRALRWLDEQLGGQWPGQGRGVND
jgi:RNA polymerase sigma-70 factor (ECF subfamily)